MFSDGKGGRCVRLTTLPPSCAVVIKSGNLNFVEPSGPLQACNGTALPLRLPLKVEPVDEKLSRYKSNWLRHVTRMNSIRMTIVMLNYRSNGRRRLGRPSKRLLDEAETGLSRPDW